MENARVHEQITEQLLQSLDDSRFLHVSLMNRIESRIRSKEQLERYIGVLVHKLEETNFRHESLINRIDDQMERHRRFERSLQSAATT